MTDLLFCTALPALLSRYRVCGPARFEKSLDLCVQDKRIRHDSFQNTAFSVKTLLFTKGDIYVVTVFHPQFPRTPLRTHAPQFVAHEKMAFTFRHRLPTYMDVNRPCNVILADWKPHSSNLAAYLSINKELRCLQNQFVLYFKLFFTFVEHLHRILYTIGRFSSCAILLFSNKKKWRQTGQKSAWNSRHSLVQLFKILKSFTRTFT